MPSDRRFPMIGEIWIVVHRDFTGTDMIQEFGLDIGQKVLIEDLIPNPPTGHTWDYITFNYFGDSRTILLDYFMQCFQLDISM